MSGAPFPARAGERLDLSVVVPLYDEEEFVHERNNWRGVLENNKGLAVVWCRSRANYSSEFAADINRLLPPGACDATQR